MAIHCSYRPTPTCGLSMGQCNDVQAPYVCLPLGSVLFTEHPSCHQSLHLDPGGLRDATTLHKNFQACLCIFAHRSPAVHHQGNQTSQAREAGGVLLSVPVPHEYFRLPALRSAVSLAGDGWCWTHSHISQKHPWWENWSSNCGSP